jgi:hypothetical protein
MVATLWTPTLLLTTTTTTHLALDHLQEVSQPPANPGLLPQQHQKLQ